MKITEEQVIRWKSTGATTVRVFYDRLEATEEDLDCNDQLVGLEVADAWPIPQFKKELIGGRSADEVKDIIRQFIQNHEEMRGECSYETMIYRALSGDMEGIKYDAYDFMSDEYKEGCYEDGDDGFNEMFYIDLAATILGYDLENLSWGSEEWKKTDALSFELMDLYHEQFHDEDEDDDE